MASVDASVSADQNAVATGSLSSVAPSASSSSPDPAVLTSQLDPFTAEQNSSPYTPGDGSAPFTPDGSNPAANPYTCSLDTDPFTGVQTSDSFTGTQSADPFTSPLNYTPAGPELTSSQLNYTPAGPELNYTPAGPELANSQLNYTPAGPELNNYASTSDANPADATGQSSDNQQYLAAGAMFPLGNYGVPGSVASWLRSEASDVFGEELVTSIETGTYSPQVAEFIDRYGLDVATELAEGYQETGKFVTLEEEAEGLQSMWNVTHGESLASTPQAGAEASNLGMQSQVDHFYGDHAGNWSNNPAEYGNSNYGVDPVAEEELGEPNLNIEPEPEGVPSSEIDWFGEGEGFAGEAGEGAEFLEGAELLEGAGTAVEVGEGLELADALWLLIFL